MPSDFMSQRSRDLLPGGMKTPQNRLNTNENITSGLGNNESSGEKRLTAEFNKESKLGQEERKEYSLIS